MATTRTLILGVLIAGCASGRIPSDAEAVPAVDAPEQFLVGSHTDASTRAPTSGEGCRSPMVDPRDGTRLTLSRSEAGRGDYEVPAGRYGVSASSLLRLDCATGAVVGVVPR